MSTDSCRVIGASTVTLALAVVDFAPMYLVGLLRAISSHKIYHHTSLLQYALVLVTEGDVVSINNAGCTSVWSSTLASAWTKSLTTSV